VLPDLPEITPHTQQQAPISLSLLSPPSSDQLAHDQHFTPEDQQLKQDLPIFASLAPRDQQLFAPQRTQSQNQQVLELQQRLRHQQASHDQIIILKDKLHASEYEISRLNIENKKLQSELESRYQEIYRPSKQQQLPLYQHINPRISAPAAKLRLLHLARSNSTTPEPLSTRDDQHLARSNSTTPELKEIVL
jgi:hypothetical protein